MGNWSRAGAGEREWDTHTWAEPRLGRSEGVSGQAGGRRGHHCLEPKIRSSLIYGEQWESSFGLVCSEQFSKGGEPGDAGNTD